MKRAAPLVFLAVCLHPAIVFAQSQWSKQLTPSTGWVAEDNKLFWTTDSGENWKNIRPPQTGQLSAVFFLDTSRGFAVVSKYNDEPIGEGVQRDTNDFWLCTTNDAGSNWSSHRIMMPEWAAPEAILLDNAYAHFWDMLHGIVAIDGGGLVLTNDGGETWHWADSPGFGSMVFTSRLDGWLRGESAKFEYNGQLFVTHDGAQHWQQVNLPMPERARYHYSLPFFTDKRHGFLTVSGSGPGLDSITLFSSTNGGGAWKRGATLPLDLHTAFTAVGTEWREAKLANGRLSVTALSSTSPPSGGGIVDERFRMIESFDMLDAANGWAVVEANGRTQLLSTSDAGRTWKNISPFKMAPAGASTTSPLIWKKPTGH